MNKYSLSVKGTGFPAEEGLINLELAQPTQPYCTPSCALAPLSFVWADKVALPER